MRWHLRNVSKRYGSTNALADVSLEIAAGQAVAVIGENGAGKSTLMKVLAGIVSPDSGELWIDDHCEVTADQFRYRSPRDAMDQGIALIHQELNLHDNLSVAENLFLGRQPTRNRFPLRQLGWIDRSEIHRKSEIWLDRVGLAASPGTSVASLPIASKQLLEIARAISMDARLVIMDEPTSSLSNDESDRLFELIRELQSDGVAILYISHRMHEITRMAERVEVLRDGKSITTLTGSEIRPDVMIENMVGRELTSQTDRVCRPGETLLKVCDLQVESEAAPPINLDVAAGEVVVLVGLVGAGRTEILETIFGIRHRAGGTVEVLGQRVGLGCRAAIDAGLGLVPEDRKLAGLFLESSVLDNITMTAMGQRDEVRINRRWQATITTDLMKRLNVKSASSAIAVASLSGGNQQKVALAKWMHGDTRVWLLDEPTRGVDIGAKAEIYQLIQKATQQSDAPIGVLAVSSDMEEVFAIADRVLVVSDGRISGELMRDELSEEAIMRLAVETAAT
ncbi:MAG: sugar ABC transporter ATP-binding protein [Planctomycetota bacterium]